ncbi:MAG TPA: hypothetical protein VIH60_04800 [Steroidobacteraceae bacterium]
MSELPKGTSTAMPDPDVTITLPLSAWQVVMKCLGNGSFNDVAKIVYLIGEQSEPQIRAAQAAVSAKAQEPGPESMTEAHSLN